MYNIFICTQDPEELVTFADCKEKVLPQLLQMNC